MKLLLMAAIAGISSGHGIHTIETSVLLQLSALGDYKCSLTDMVIHRLIDFALFEASGETKRKVVHDEHSGGGDILRRSNDVTEEKKSLAKSLDEIVPCLLKKFHAQVTKKRGGKKVTWYEPKTDNMLTEQFVTKNATVLAAAMLEMYVTPLKAVEGETSKEEEKADSPLYLAFNEILKLHELVSDETIGSGEYQFDGRVRTLTMASPFTVQTKALRHMQKLDEQVFDLWKNGCVKWWSVPAEMLCSGESAGILKHRVEAGVELLNTIYGHVKKEQKEAKEIKAMWDGFRHLRVVAKKGWTENSQYKQEEEKLRRLVEEMKIFHFISRIQWRNAKFEYETLQWSQSKYETDSTFDMGNVMPKTCFHLEKSCEDEFNNLQSW